MHRFAKLPVLATLAVSLCLAACGGDSHGPEPLPATGPPPAAGTIGDGRLGELVEWARASQRMPAMGVVLVRNGQIAEKAAVGLRSSNAPVAVADTDRWHLGSLTKAMTATLAALLVEQGVISWDTTVLEVWPEFSSSIHAGFRGATLRQLLSHTSGMERDIDYGPASITEPAQLIQTRRELSERVLARGPAFPAGQMYYSNIAYVVAGAMLETRTGTAWETLMNDLVFAPLGMTHAGFGAPGVAGQLDEPLGHRGAGRVPIPPDSADNPRSLGPAGTVHATLDDYANFLVAHIAGERGVPGIVSVESFQTLHREVAGGYALGWGLVSGISGSGGGAFTHDGSNGAWYARVWFSPARDVGMLLVTNAASVRAQAAIGALDELMRTRLDASP